jgi:hypothetical protein
MSEGRTNPKLWEESKKKAIEKMGGKWSARTAQLSGLYYRQAGGGYIGPKTKAMKDLTKWSIQDWRTSSGKPSLETGERYLPSAILKRLTKKEIEATNKAKKEGMKKGIQYVPQPKKIVEKIKKIKKKI